MKVYMFHYVTENFNYYHFDKNEFEEVIKQLSSTKKIINLKQLKQLQNKNEEINDDFVMLTFDDGTIDHYKYVYPILKKYNSTGLFFICSNIINKSILDIQFIHQLLNRVSANEIYLEIQKYILENNIAIDTNSIVDSKLGNWKEIYIKRIIQTVFTLEHSKEILEKLIRKYNISINFEDYYMSIDNMLEMKKNKMEFGCHTNIHKRLSLLTKEEQTEEIRENMQVLYKNNLLTEQDILSVAYPFGNYNALTMEVLKELDFDFAFTVKEDNIYKVGKYEIPRYDCNILKKSNKK